MSTRVAKLESLLHRVQERAQMPRVVAAPVTAQHAEPLALDEPGTADEGLSLDEPLAVESTPTHDFDQAPRGDGQAHLQQPHLEMAPPSAQRIHELDEIDDVQVDEIDDLDVDEQPESGPVVTTTIDDALEEADYQPPLTPPPESGEEVAMPHIPPQRGPTMEQLGQTISLEEGQTQQFELDEPTLTDHERSTEDGFDDGDAHMEAPLPRSVPAHDDLQAPENAREELERIRLGDSTPVEARVSKRPVLSTNVVEFASASRSYEPTSFLDLVDSSLTLG